MKRIAMAAILLTAFCFAACTGGGTAPAETEAPAGWDFDNRFGNGQDCVVETDEAYYYNAPGGEYLYYYDKESGNSGVLCGKPECIHDSKQGNTACNGYVQFTGSVGFRDGRLHFVMLDLEKFGKYELLSMNPDGTDRRADAYINMETLRLSDMVYATPQRYDHHRGKLYGWYVTEFVRDGEPLVETCILSVDAVTGDINKLYSVETYDHMYYKPSLFYLGKYVYFFLEHIEDAEDGAYTHMELRRWDTEKEELEEVFISREEGFLGDGMRIWVESEDLIYIMPKSLREGEPNKLYKLSGGELGAVCTFDIEGLGSILDGAAFVGSPDTGEMEIRRFDGSVIYEGEWKLDMLDTLGSEEKPSYHISSVFGDENELLISIVLYRMNSDIPMTFCLVRYELASGGLEPTVLACDPRRRE